MSVISKNKNEFNEVKMVLMLTKRRKIPQGKKYTIKN